MVTKKSELTKKERELDIVPISNILMRIYAIFAIIIVIIPERLAELIIALMNINLNMPIAPMGLQWEADIELRLTKMTFKELRILASELRIQGYSRDTKQNLYKKLYKKLSK